MAMPTNGNARLWLALLHELERAGGEATPGAVIPGMRRHFPEITDDEVAEVHAKTGHNVWEFRVHWARMNLVLRGLIDGTTRGVWRITPEGTRWLHRYWLDADAPNGDVPRPPKLTDRQPAPAPARAVSQAFGRTAMPSARSSIRGAAMRRVLTRALDGSASGLDSLDYYLVACIGHELGNFGDAVHLLDTALTSGLDGEYRSKAEQLRAVCALKAGG